MNKIMIVIRAALFGMIVLLGIPTLIVFMAVGVTMKKIGEGICQVGDRLVPGLDKPPEGAYGG